MRAILFVLLFPALCLASDWKPVPGTDVRYDRATMTRDGDIITVWASNSGEPTPVKTVIDCAKRTILALNRRDDVPPDSVAERALETICKRSWEVWK